ncbi:hypothetical protein DZC30_12800 [Comamonas testosteroni]|uniref:Lipoprotein n=1 Tax=Comamonas testosteroni TaxID=285 RepID=A0A373FMN9_COMTE|nr:hypothetical protein [Comamonas testosteroni]RGE44745.1 hypothetical protein DZC30_12800 [Comamonas testosteroni]
MPRNLMSAACALTCAAMLAACNDAPAPTSAPAPIPAHTSAPVAAPAAPAQAQEPAATAEIVPSGTVQQIVALHVAKPGEESLSSLKALEGKYRWDGVDYLKTGVLAERLKALTGSDYATILQNLDTVGPLSADGGRLMVYGNRRHMGGEESAAIVIDTERNGLRVLLLSGGQLTDFTDVAGAEISWPESVQSLIRDLQVK